MDFDRKHGDNTGGKMINTLKKTKWTSTDEGTTGMVLAYTVPYVWRFFRCPVYAAMFI